MELNTRKQQWILMIQLAPIRRN